MKKSILVIVMLLCFALGGFIFRGKGDKGASEVTVGQKCDSKTTIPEGYQCYYYGPSSARLGVLIKLDYRQPIEFSSDFFSAHRAAAGNWKLFSAPKKDYEFRYPGEFSVQIDQDGVSVFDKRYSELPHLTLTYFEDNAVPMKNNFPKGCFEMTEQFGGKEAHRFDCVGRDNLAISNKTVSFFVKVDGGYYNIVAHYIDDSFADFATDALLATFKFTK